MAKKKERRKSVDYGKIAGAVSGRSMAFIDPTIATRRKAEKRELERKAKMATADLVGGVASGVATLGSAAQANLESWEQQEAGLRAVGGESATLKSTGADPGLLKRAFTAAPAGGAFTVEGAGGAMKAFTGSEISGIGKAVQGGYAATIGMQGKTLFQSFGGTLAEGAGTAGWSAKGYDPSDITAWGVSSPSNITGVSSSPPIDPNN